MDNLDMVFNQLVSDIDRHDFNESFDFAESAGGDYRKFKKIIYPAVQLTLSLARFYYGVEMDSTIYAIDRSEYSKFYHYLSTEDFLKVKGGLCYDYCRFLYSYLKQKGYDVTLYFMEIAGTKINHTFPMIRVPSPSGDRYLYCESAKKNIYGAYSTTDPDGLINAIVNVFRYETIITKPTKVIIRTYNQIKSDDLSYDELLSQLRKGKIYDEWVIKPKASVNGNSGSKANASKFNPGLLIGDSTNIVRE